MQSNRFFLGLFFLVFANSLYAQKGTVKGRVRNSVSLEPIEFAALIIEGTKIGATTDLEGRFVFASLEPGEYRLMVSSLGFETTLSAPFKLSASQTIEVNVVMRPSILELKEVVVRVDPTVKKIEAPLSFQVIAVQDLEKNAGANRDVSRVLQTLPGVGFTDPNRTDLIVRGGGPSENVFYLDGVEIPTINHFSTQGSSGGAVGIINPDFVREINFYSGAFPANRPHALSSVMDIKQVDGNNERWHVKAAVGASDASLTMDGPVGDRSTLMVSARRSYLQLLFSALQLPFLPTYNDAQLKWKTRFNARNELTILALSACDKTALNTGIAEPTEEQSYLLNTLPVFRHYNYTVGAVYKHFSKKGYNTWVLSRNWLRNNNFKYPNNDAALEKYFDFRSDESENKLRYERVFTALPFDLMMGAGLKYSQYTNATYRQQIANDTLENQNYASNLALFGGQAFAQISDRFFEERLKTSFGLAWTFNNYNPSMWSQLSPRFSLSWVLADKANLNFHAGRYAQAPSYTAMGFRNKQGEWVNKESLRPIYSNHLLLGMDVEPAKNVRMSIEGFWKYYQHYPVSLTDGVSLASKGADFGSVGDEALTSTGRGRSYGVEYLTRWNDGKNWNAQLTYTLFRSEFTDLSGQYRSSSWDVRHLLNAMAQYKTASHWIFGARWRWAGGAPYSPIDEELSSQIDVWNSLQRPVFDYANYNALRKPSTHQLDIRIDKEFHFSRWMLNFYVDIQNVYNFKSKGTDIYTPTNENGDLEYADAEHYRLRRLEVDTGIILPSIGIIVKL